MYDMYRWDQPARSGERPAPAPASARRDDADGGPRRPDEAARAVQEALDRRDNGGATAASRDR